MDEPALGAPDSTPTTPWIRFPAYQAVALTFQQAPARMYLRQGSYDAHPVLDLPGFPKTSYDIDTKSQPADMPLMMAKCICVLFPIEIVRVRIYHQD
jgi:hypothetical protein